MYIYRKGPGKKQVIGPQTSEQVSLATRLIGGSTPQSQVIISTLRGLWHSSCIGLTSKQAM